VRRLCIQQEDIVSFNVLTRAAMRAARGKRARPDVVAFFSDFHARIARLRRDVLSGAAPYNDFRRFRIQDPKERLITAVSFDDRVLHHALMDAAAPALERAMIDHTYACLPGRGPLAAVRQAQANSRRYPWYAKIDIDKYFESIPHEALLGLLRRKLKGALFHELVARILRGYEVTPGRGIPIGSLTSQHFANFYLDRVDRLVQERSAARAYVRYMDDMVWWCDDRETARATLASVTAFIERELSLKVKANRQIQRSGRGLGFCGYRVFPWDLRLTARKKTRYVARRRHWERLHEQGFIGAGDLQRAYDSVRAVVEHASSRAWLQREIGLHPSPDV
jgi:RNA-directed DNA polymerase